MDFVLDASVAIAWVLRDEVSIVSEALLEAFETGNGYAPAIWPLEVANALLMAERGGRIPEGGATELLASLAQLEIDVEVVSTIDHLDVELALAREHRLTIYDASYLALAMRLNAPLATLDQRLRAAARNAGVALLSD